MKTRNEMMYLKLVFKQVWRNPTEKKGLILYIPVYLSIWIGLIIFHNNMSPSFSMSLITIATNYILMIRMSVAIIGADATLIGHLLTSPCKLNDYFHAKIIFLQLISGISIVIGALLFIIFRLDVFLLCAISSVYLMGTFVYPLLILQLIYYQPIKEKMAIKTNISTLYALFVILLLYFLLNVISEWSAANKAWAFYLIALPGIICVCFQPVWVKGLINIFLKNKFKIFSKAQLV